MIAFEPQSGKHAIAEVVFMIHYEGTLKPDAIAQAKARRERYQAFLPVEQEVAGFQVRVGGGPAASPAFSRLPDGGFIWQRIKPDGSVGWQVTIQQDLISVNCLEYTRWGEVWARAGEWLSDLHPVLEQAGHRAKSVSLQYIDQFSRKQPVTSPILKELFSDRSAFLPPRFFSNGELWHVHQGWIEDVAKPLKGQKLSVLNIGSARGGGVNVVTIDHLMRVDVATDSPPLFTTSIKGSIMDETMTSLHDENVSVLSDLLTDEVARYIKLKA